MLICDLKSQREFFNYEIVGIAAIVVLCSQVWSDSLGRAYTLKMFTYFICAFALLGYFVENIHFRVFAMAIFVGEEQTVCTLFTYIINESTTTKSSLRSTAIGIYFCCFAMGGVIIACLSYVIHDPDSLYLFIVLSCILFSLSLEYTVKESPKQLKKMGLFKQLFSALLLIGERNRRDVTINDLQKAGGVTGIDMEVVNKCNIVTEMTFIQKLQLIKWNFEVLFCTDYFRSLISYLVLCGCLRTINNCATFSSGDIGPYLQINVMLLCLVEAMAYLCATFYAAYLPRRKTSLYCL